MNRFTYARAGSLEDATKRVGSGGLPKAGGVDLLGRMKRGTLRPELLVDLNSIKDMQGISRSRDGKELKIGALIKLAEIESAKLVTFAGLREAAGKTATPQIRNIASLAGNLLQSQRCWYLHDPEVKCHGKGQKGCPAKDGRNENHAILGYSDCPTTNSSSTAPILSALGAVLDLRLADGKSGEIEVRKLYENEGAFSKVSLPKGALVTAIRVPIEGLATAHVEVRHKESDDWAITIAAVALGLDGGRIADPRIYLGAVAPEPWHAVKAEAVVRGQTPSHALFERAADAELTQARPLSEGGYKLKMTRYAIIQALEKATARAGEAGR